MLLHLLQLLFHPLPFLLPLFSGFFARLLDCPLRLFEFLGELRDEIHVETRARSGGCMSTAGD
jgi:hypothetical protein